MQVPPLLELTVGQLRKRRIEERVTELELCIGVVKIKRIRAAAGPQSIGAWKNGRHGATGIHLRPLGAGKPGEGRFEWTTEKGFEMEGVASGQLDGFLASQVTHP